MYSGNCLCGAVEIEVHGGIEAIIHCHCSLCRKSSGTAYATNGFIDASALRIVAGADALRGYSPRPGRTRWFCGTCGSPVYSSNDQDPARYRLRLGILDDDIVERPISHNFVGSRANWDDLDAGLPRHDGHEPGRIAASMRPDVPPVRCA